jgi:hypothetical protein
VRSLVWLMLVAVGSKMTSLSYGLHQFIYKRMLTFDRPTAKYYGSIYFVKRHPTSFTSDPISP